MKYFASFVLLFSAAALITYEQMNLKYWLTSPEERVNTKWKQDIENTVRVSKKLNTAIHLIKKIELTVTDSQFQSLITKSKIPFKKTDNGKYTLKIQVMPWIEDMNYGYLIQHEFFDETQNKVFEFNSNIDIGKLW